MLGVKFVGLLFNGIYPVCRLLAHRAFVSAHGTRESSQHLSVVRFLSTFSGIKRCIKFVKLGTKLVGLLAMRIWFGRGTCGRRVAGASDLASGHRSARNVG